MVRIRRASYIFTNVQRLYRKGLFGVWESTDTMEVSFLFLHFYIRTASWEETPPFCVFSPWFSFPFLLVVRRPTLVFLSRFRIAARHIALHLHTQILGNNLGRIFDILLRPVRGDSGCFFFFVGTVSLTALAAYLISDGGFWTESGGFTFWMN